MVDDFEPLVLEILSAALLNLVREARGMLSKGIPRDLGELLISSSPWEVPARQGRPKAPGGMLSSLTSPYYRRRWGTAGLPQGAATGPTGGKGRTNGRIC